MGELHEAITEGNEDLVKRLLDRRTDVNTRNEAGETPLMRAAELGRVPIARLLLERGADVHAVQEADGWTALHIAADKGHAECVLALLEAGAEVDARDQHSWTPLLCAASASYAATVRVLLEQGADIHAEDDRGSSALAEAGWLADEETIHTLLDWGAGQNPAHLQDAFFACFIDNNSDKAPLFLQAGVQVGLHEAILLGGMWIWIVPTLLEQGADVNARKSKGKITPLILAVEYQNLSMVKMLLEHKADPNARDAQGRTPLIIAARLGDTEAVKLLLQYEADPNIQDDYGFKAFE